ncbi:MAG: M15 family metallopeptidase [Erysipelotrichaceae bacterium]|nr:M15 family metallopeptidase [Erysipelotrichaceae bacterium]
MKSKRLLFVSVIAAVALICIGIMNIRYDRLSRYPYQDAEARAIIEKHFSNKDIEYLIEYSIAPSTFIKYVTYEGFSIYHADDYNFIRDKIWYLTDEEVVNIVELGRDVMSMDQLANMLLKYDSITVFHYLKHRDEYAKDSILIDNPDEIIAYVDNTHTVSTRILFENEPLTMISSSSENVVMAKTAVEPLKAMCTAIETELGNKKTCGGLVADAGYIDYETQKMLYLDLVEQYGDQASFYGDYPGHSEHQLGLAIDFSVNGFKQENFEDSAQYKWLKENAHRFGFVQSYTVDKQDLTEKAARPWHWRYVGHELAAEMYFNSLCLKETISWEE